MSQQSSVRTQKPPEVFWEESDLRQGLGAYGVLAWLGRSGVGQAESQRFCSEQERRGGGAAAAATGTAEPQALPTEL